MSLESAPQEQQRLLPEILEDRLIGIFGRAAGVALVVLVATGWISLLSWSVTDPSLTHATSGATHIDQRVGAPACSSACATLPWSISQSRQVRPSDPLTL